MLVPLWLAGESIAWRIIWSRILFGVYRSCVVCEGYGESRHRRNNCFHFIQQNPIIQICLMWLSSHWEGMLMGDHFTKFYSALFIILQTLASRWVIKQFMNSSRDFHLVHCRERCTSGSSILLFLSTTFLLHHWILILEISNWYNKDGYIYQFMKCHQLQGLPFSKLSW